MMKTFVKKHFPALVAFKRRIQFAITNSEHDFDAWLYARRIERRVIALRGRDCYRVAFLIYNAGEFPFEKLFRLMLCDRRFAPYVVVIPENICGIDNKRRIAVNVEMLRAKYGPIIHNPLDEAAFRDIRDKCDLAFTCNPYDHNTDEAYRVEYLSKSGVPVVLTNYFYYQGGEYSESVIARRPPISFAWRYYAENDKWRDCLSRYHRELRKRGRIRCLGVPKLDLMDEVQKKSRLRKMVLLAPHHSVRDGVGINFGNFHRYSDFMLSLPERYPQIDWVFRPHPLLKVTLESSGMWKPGRWEQYIRDFVANPNAEYRPYGPYWDMFVNSDGIIQDCGSFLAEYHCTGHPQCYVIKSVEHMRKQFSSWGEELISYTYAADSEEKIVDYIENVILKGEDVKADARKKFVEEKMMPNYPHASECILADLKKDLGII